MTHYTDEDLILHYYGDGKRRTEVEAHLEDCATCAALYCSIGETLPLVSEIDVPERDESYAFAVWQRLQAQPLERHAPWWYAWFEWSPATAAAATLAAVALAVVAFVSGRSWPPREAAPFVALRSHDGSEAANRAQLAAIADHLERSEGVLLDLANWDGQAIDLSDEQTGAAELIDANRLYRDAATRTGDARVVSVLDDLERGLLDVVHAPSKPTPAQIEEIRLRMDAAALVFKLRILADELHERETAPVVRKAT